LSAESLSTQQKALEVNMDSSRYGTVAEIGGGQEVARWFFRVGGAAGTVAKSMSAYDMKFSDAIYGPSPRYVSRERLEVMLDYEYGLLIERLDAVRGENTSFFAFANTVTTRSYTRREDGHGWVGIKFQAAPRQQPSRVVLHIRLFDPESTQQHEALGLLGVNLIYGVCYLHQQPGALLASLSDQLSHDRVEVNFIEFSGPAFSSVDNRRENLRLLETRQSEGVLFDPAGQPAAPGVLLYKKPILLYRGAFHPVTNVHLDMLASASRHFSRTTNLQNGQIVTLLELTTRNLLDPEPAEFDPADYLARLDTLALLEKPVLVSSIPEFHRLAGFLQRYSKRELLVVLGVRLLQELFKEKYYAEVEGGLLEVMGRIFHRGVRGAIYPARDPQTNQLRTAGNVELEPRYRHLYRFLLDNNYIQPLEDYDESVLDITPFQVLHDIRSGGTRWESQVPPRVAELIKERRLFGLPG